MTRPARLRLLGLLGGYAGAVLVGARASRSAARQREYERAIVDAMADGLAVVGPDGRVRVWNVAAAALTGISPEQAMGCPLPFPDGAREHLLPGGRWVEVLSSPLPARGGRVVTFRDISTAKMVDEAKSLFLATSGHELRSPVTVIQGFAETLSDRWDELTDAERREAAATIQARAAGLAALVDQVLTSSQAEAGVRRLERRPLAVGPLLATAAVDVSSLSSRHRVAVAVADDLPMVLADEQAVRTILGHLVANAVSYSPDGGLIELSVAADEPRGMLVVRVDDEGIGVESADQERVFERFFQADGGDTRRQGGFGLGLYIVRRLVQAHDGDVSMARRPDGRRGSRVEVLLPLCSAG